MTNASAFASGVDAAATGAIIAALNVDATLAGLGVTATATGTRVTLKGVTKHNAKDVAGVIKRLAPSSKAAAGVDGGTALGGKGSKQGDDSFIVIINIPKAGGGFITEQVPPAGASPAGIFPRGRGTAGIATSRFAFWAALAAAQSSPTVRARLAALALPRATGKKKGAAQQWQFTPKRQRNGSWLLTGKYSSVEHITLRDTVPRPPDSPDVASSQVAPRKRKRAKSAAAPAPPKGAAAPAPPLAVMGLGLGPTVGWGGRTPPLRLFHAASAGGLAS